VVLAWVAGKSPVIQALVGGVSVDEVLLRCGFAGGIFGNMEFQDEAVLQRSGVFRLGSYPIKAMLNVVAQ
jgi:hypothetical protein